MHSHGSGAALLLNHDQTLSEVCLETDSANGSSVALRCELRDSPALEPQTAGSTASGRTVVPTSAQAVREDEATASTKFDETRREDAVLRAVTKKAKQHDPLTGFERRSLVAALVRDLPWWSI